MENYKNSRDELKKQLFDKLMCDRFGWEINIGEDIFIIEAALTTEDNEEKIKTIEKICRNLLLELDTYLFVIEDQLAEFGEVTYQNIPTIFCLMKMSIEFDDTPIKEEDVYEVDESTLQRKPDYALDAKNTFKDFEAWRE